NVRDNRGWPLTLITQIQRPLNRWEITILHCLATHLQPGLRVLPRNRVLKSVVVEPGGFGFSLPLMKQDLGGFLPVIEREGQLRRWRDQALIQPSLFHRHLCSRDRKRTATNHLLGRCEKA